MATETKKFSTEELKSLTDIRSQFSDVSYKLGQVEIQKLALDEERRKLLTIFNETVSREKAVAKELIDKYGKGTIDIDSGEFIPSA